MNTDDYITAFKRWMNDWNPHAFATANLPRERSASREASFYLSLWTRSAEADVLGPRTLKLSDFDRRIVWLFRREVSGNGLVHFHAVVKFPMNRPWLDERPDFYSVVTRCDRLESALRAASSRTPEAFAGKGIHSPCADIDVRPYDADRNHAGYLLKGMRRFIENRNDFSSEELLRDSGLVVLPHLPKKNISTR